MRALIPGAVLLTVLAAWAQTAPAPEVKSADPCRAVSTTTPDPNTTSVQLNAVRRIFVDSFGEDPISREMQSTIVSALVNARKFIVTEDPRRADAVLKGVALENTSQEVHSYSEGTAVKQASVTEASSHTQTLNEAKLSIRLVNSDGDVIWTTTQESKGAKYKSASADVADMCVKQLLRDVAKLESPSPESRSAATPVHNN